MAKILISFAILAGFAAQSQSQISEDLPSFYFHGLQSAAIPTLLNLIESDQKNYNNSIDAFKPVNETCNQIVAAKTQNCVNCVKAACTARARDLCKPEGFDKFLYDSKVFFEQGLPNFFSETLPNFAVSDVGGAFVTLGSETNNFFKNGGFQTGLAEINNAFKFDKWGDAFKGIGDIDFKGILSNIGSGIGDLFSGNLFGRRRRDLYEILTNAQRARRSVEEPTECSQIKDNPSTACMYYVKTCDDCDIQKTRDCPGYESALENVIKAMKGMKWLTMYTANTFSIKKISFKAADRDFTGMLATAMVTVDVFGNTVTFEAKNLNPYIPDKGGPVIAEGARAALNAMNAAE